MFGVLLLRTALLFDEGSNQLLHTLCYLQSFDVSREFCPGIAAFLGGWMVLTLPLLQMLNVF